MAYEGGGPQQQVMGDGDFNAVTGGAGSLLVKQTARGWIQECCGCDAKNEYQISQHEWGMHEDNGFLKGGARDQKNVLYALEQSSFLMRCCCKDGRAMEMPVTIHNPNGKNGEGGQTHMTLKKDLGMPVNFVIVLPTNDKGETTKIDVPCCCLLPRFKAYDANGNLFSETAYVCDMFLYVPKFDYIENGQVKYRLAPPTCCMGCCIECECGSRGMCNVTTPFYFYEPGKGHTEEFMIKDGFERRVDRPQILQVWGGLAKECCTTADTFAIKFPANASAQEKAGLLNACLLIDFAWFEGHSEAHGSE